MILKPLLRGLPILLLAACTVDSTRRGYLEALRPRLEKPVRPVVVIAGFGVTRLYDPVTGRFVWGTPRTTVHTRYEDDLDLPIDPATGLTTRDRLVPRGWLGSRGPVNIGWQLTEALRKYGGYAAQSARHPIDPATVTVYPFYYDWRLSFSTNASELDAFIDTIRRDHGDPVLAVDLVGHSAGGLVILTYLKLGTASPSEPARWSEAARWASSKVHRAVLIATPQQGTIDAFRILIDEERFLRRRLSFDLIGAAPSVAELLPFDGRFLVAQEGTAIAADLRDPGAWRELGLGPFDPARATEVTGRIGEERYRQLVRAFEVSLENAAWWRKAIVQAPQTSVPIDLIAGDCVPTANRVVMRRDRSFAFYRKQLRPGEEPLGRLLFEPGDGSVTRSSARGGGNRGQLFCDGHQGIAADPNVHRALIRILLEDGR